MPAESTAVISFVGKDSGLSSVIGNAIKSITDLTQSTSAGSDMMAGYAENTLSLQSALGATTDAAKGSISAIAAVGSATSDAYSGIVTNSERTIKVADVLSESFAKLALKAAGLGQETDAVNSVLQPTAGFFNAVASEATGLGKAFEIINAAEKPVVGGLNLAANAASSLAGVLSNLGGVGEFAAQGLTSVANAAASLAGIVGNVDTIGDLYKNLENLKEALPGIAEGFQEAGGAIKSSGSTILGITDATTEAEIGLTVLSKVTSGATKNISELAVSAIGLKRSLGFVVDIAGVVVNSLIAATLHAKDFGKGLETIKNLGFDTYSTELVSSLGLVGEQLLFNVKASKEFADAAVSAFSKVQDAIASVTTLPAGLKAGIPQLSDQLRELVNGPLKNAITSGEAAGAMYQTLSAGIGAAAGKIKESKPFLEAALKLSTGTETNAGTAVETLAKVTYAYSLNTKEATTTAAKLNGVVEEGIVTMPQLANNIGRVAGVAAQAKVPLNEMLGSIAALTKTMSADDAMTGYISLLNSITGAGEQSKKVAAEMGVQFDLQAVKAKGLLNVLRELYEKSGGDFAKIKEVVPDSLAFAALQTLVTTAFSEAKQKSDVISKKNGADLDALFGARQQSLIKQTTALVNGFQEVLADFGEKFSKMFQPGVDFLKEMLERFKSMPEPVKELVGAIVGMNAAIDKAAGFVSILFGAFTQLALTFAFMRAAAIVFNGALRDQLLVSLKQVFIAFKDGSGRTQALINVFKNFTGVVGIQEKATEGLTHAQGLLSKINQTLFVDLGKLAKGYAESALSAEKAAIANGLLGDKMKDANVAKSVAGAASPVGGKGMGARIMERLGITDLEALAQQKGAEMAQKYVASADAAASKAIEGMGFRGKANIVIKQALTDLGGAFQSLSRNLLGFDKSTLDASRGLLTVKEAAAGTAGGVVLYNEAMTGSQVAMGSWKQVFKSFVLYNEEMKAALGSSGLAFRLFGTEVNLGKLASIDLGATLKQLPANLGQVVQALMIARNAQSLTAFQTKALAFASTVLGAGLKVATISVNALSASLSALWTQFGPLIIAVGGLVAAFQLMGEFVALDILGFKTAASEAQEYAAGLTDLGDASKQLAKHLDDQTSSLENNSKAYRARINELNKDLDKDNSEEGRQAIKRKIDDLNKLEEAAKKAEDKKYTGIINTFAVPFLEETAKEIAYMSILRLDSKKTEKAIEDFATNVKDSWQEVTREHNGINAAMEESNRQTDQLIEHNNKAARSLKLGDAYTKESREIQVSAKTRKLTADELLKINKSETQAYEQSKEAIDAKTTALQKQLEVAKDPRDVQNIQLQIDALNRSTKAYDENLKAAQKRVENAEAIKGAILGNKGITVKIAEITREQDKLILGLQDKMKHAANDTEKALYENQLAAAKGNLGILKQVADGSYSTGELQKKQLNQMLSAYNDFSDNVTKSGERDLNEMRSKADKLMGEVENNLDNLDGKTAQKLVDAILDQQVRLKRADLAGSIISPEQTQAALDLAKKAYEKNAQQEIDINNRTISKISDEKEEGIKRDTLAQKETLELELKNDEERIKAKQKYLARVAPEIGRESDTYKRLNDEIVNLAYGVEQKKMKIVQAGIDDRAKLVERGNAREEALNNLAIAKRTTNEEAGQKKIYELKQKNNLEQRKLLIERIDDYKSRGGDFTELETQLLQLQAEFEKNAIERAKQISERQKQVLTNEATKVTQEYQKQSNVIELISSQMQRQQNLLSSRSQLLQSELQAQEGRIQLQLRLTGDLQKSANLEFSLAQRKFENLGKTQVIEKQQLVLSSQLNKLAAEKEIIGNRIARTENERAIAQLKIDQLQAKKENRSKEELAAMDLQMESLVEQQNLLKSQGQGLEEAKRNQEDIARNSEKELMARQKIAGDNGVVDLYLAKIKKSLVVYEIAQQQAEIYAKRIELATTAEINKADALTKVYDRQSQVLNAQKTAIESKTGRLTTELQIAIELTSNEGKKQQLAQAIAQIKFRSLVQQQEMERKVLELNILQNKAASEREKIQNRVEQAQNKAETIGAYAQLQKTLADPKSTNLQKISDQLAVQAKLEQGAALSFAASQQGEKDKLQDYLANSQRENLRDSQSVARRQGQMEIIGTLNPGARAIASMQLKKEILNDDLGFSGVGNQDENFKSLGRGNVRGLSQIFPGSSKLADRANRDYGYGYQPQITAPADAPNFTSGNYDEQRKNFLAQMQEFLVAPNLNGTKLQSPPIPGLKFEPKNGEINTDNKPDKMPEIKDVKVTIEAINITTKSGKDSPEEAAKEVQNQILDKLYSIGTRVKERLK